MSISKKLFTDDDELKLRTYARRTWFYFERFVNENQSWLPPDNFQEDPHLEPVARTSPTNIGLALVANQTAYNMGYITFGELLDRSERTLKSLELLERYRGHFYNWYDTKVGGILQPKYISTVDSGNLAAGLITIKESINKEIKKNIINKNLWRGLKDTVSTLELIFQENELQEILSADMIERINYFLNKIKKNLDLTCPIQSVECLKLLKIIKEDARDLSAIDLMKFRNELGDNRLADLLFWLETPLKLTEKAITEYRLMIDLNSMIGDQSLISLFDKSELNSEFSSDILNKWSRQAREIIEICEKLVSEMDFTFLYIKKRGLFHIGFDVDKSQPDLGTYDLLASEARIASYIAIAKGDIPSEHWFRLSRRLTSLEKNEILLSWGGTMFEYLMPLLFMHSYPNTLLSHTYDSVVKWHQIYGARRGHPWGASESAYYYLNIDMHYQYRAFGVPGLGLKRGLAEEYVIAPYASILSLMVDPGSAIKNLIKIENIGGLGLLGFYDAIDFTPSRLKESESFKVVKTYMAHHHGMSLLALDNILNGWPVHDYFYSDPQIKGCDLLFQERVPRGVPIKEPHPLEIELEPGEQEKVDYVVEHNGMNEIDAVPPRTQLLSNGSYSVFVSHTGTGCSRYKDEALTAWVPDTTTDPLGLFFYIKDLESGKFWSATHQPVKRKPDRYDTWFHNGKIVTSRVDEWIETTTEVSVSPDHPIELRKLNITNYSNVSRTLEITSYAEVVLNRLDDHNSHPAFSKLFVQTDYLPQFHSLIAKRRPRSEGENEKWLIHSFAGYNSDNIDETLQFETERSKFIGRGRSLSNPEVICNKQKLSGSLGNVSDPIMSLRKKITIKPGEKIQMVFGLGWADSLIETERLADMYDNPNAAYRAFDLGEVYSAVELGHLGITSKQAHYFQKLASYLIYPNSKYRADISVLKKNRKKQKSLWAYGISGDLPLLVFKIDKIEQLKKVETLLKAHAFWRLKGLEVELLILNDHPPSYADEVQESIIQAVESSLEAQRFNVKGGVFLLRSERIPEEDMILILTVANTVFNGSLPKFNNQMEGTETKSWDSGIYDQDYLPVKPYSGQEYTNAKAAGNENDLIMFNGFGGFTKDGGEYHIIIHPDSKNGLPELPPAPWVNIISNRNVGFIATEKGAGYTWSENSRENKLTQWSNDPVRDPHSEALYLRDEISGEFWSPTPGPTPGAGSYRVVHGFGYTKYSHDSQNLKQELLQFVPEDDPVKISKLKIKNSGDKKRYISIFSYNDLVLGVKREASVRYILNELSEDSQTIFSQNHYNNEFSGRVVFNSLIPSGKVIEYSYTNNRENFIGRNRSLENPKTIGFTDALDNEIIGSGDLCTAFQAKIELMPGEEKEIIFLIGETDDKLSANKLIQLYSSVVEVEQEFERVKKSWKKRLSRIEVETPEPSLDIIVNGWLMYQNISSRMWSRTAFYQAGGAYGFRDQLQDAMAVTYVDPSMARNQILLHAEKQFREGDVLHWWHPPTGRGIRSRISDDRLWLPYVTNFYLSATGDLSILEENVSYIKARELEPGEQEAYLEPTIDAKKGSIYEHCCKAIDISLKFGRHGLPLMGAGDWNDGMNRVGENGEGESVWLGFFIYSILTSFQEICRNRGDFDRADRYNSIAGNLKKQLNDKGWDGNWYLRAYYDDGSPLGSSINDECRIDGISQAWSVISGVAPKERGLQVLKEIEKNLISEKDGIIRLLTPPFDKTEKNPGYIKGYIPGVRENGGQYTHAALWTVKAFAKAGLGDKAVQYFNMINPINHALTLDDVSVYKAEPYVVAADVYGESPLTGQAGWTWYTGSAGWMYRVAIESILGFTLQDDKIIINPSISHSWTGFKIRYKPDLEGTIYIISVENPDKLESGRLEGNVDNKTIEFDSNEAAIKIILDGKEHSVNLTIRRREKD
ncbi:MAG: glucoamylase family protein [Balneolaceae bacterium]